MSVVLDWKLADAILHALIKHGELIDVHTLAEMLDEHLYLVEAHVSYIAFNSGQNLFQILTGGRGAGQIIIVREKEVRKIREFLARGGFQGIERRKKSFAFQARLRKAEETQRNITENTMNESTGTNTLKGGWLIRNKWWFIPALAGLIGALIVLLLSMMAHRRGWL